jgi:hypothetical protein
MLVIFGFMLLIASPGTWFSFGAFLFNPKTDAFLETIWRLIQGAFWVAAIGTLVLFIISAIDDERRKERRGRKGINKGRGNQSEAVTDPEERRLWWLAEQEAKAEVNEWETRTGKKKRPAEIAEITRRLFEKMKDNELKQG